MLHHHTHTNHAMWTVRSVYWEVRAPWPWLLLLPPHVLYLGQPIPVKLILGPAVIVRPHLRGINVIHGQGADGVLAKSPEWCGTHAK